MASIGNPQDLLTTPYGYSGQMSPEAAIAEQALNRRRLLANMLTQQGLQPSQGKMVGRFYVPASPLQGGVGLAQVLAGSLGNRMIDNEQADIIKKDQAVPAEAIAAWRKKMSEPVPAPQAAAPIPPPPQEAPATLAPATGGEQPSIPMQTLGPRPQDLPDQHTGVSNYRAPAFVGTHPSGISPEVTPGDMSTMVNSADPNKGLDQLGGQVATQPQAPPPMAPAPPPQAAPRKVTMDDLAELMTHQHPLVRAYGAVQFQQMKHDEDVARQLDQQAWERGFGEKKLKQEGEMKQLGLEANALQRSEMLRNTMAMKEMQLAQMERDSLRDAKSAERADALRAEIAKGNQEIQRMNAQTSRMQLEQGKVPPGYRKTQDGNLEAVPGGPADTKLQGVFNQDTAILNSSTAGLDRLASSANQLLNHPGLDSITGVRGKLPDIPGTNAADARSLLEKLKSQVAFDVLQDMRNNSKTGGALGNVSDAEGKRLENNLAALNTAQSPEQFKRELKSILDFSEGAKGRLRDTFNMKHKIPGASSPAPSPPASPAMKNAQGWILHTDAQGNKAYVSPDGKQFEEVR